MPYVLLLSSSFQTLAVRCDNAPPYRDELVSLHQSLVEIESITENEAKVGEFLIDYLTEKGLVAEQQFLPTSNDSVPRFNVIAWPKTRPSGASKVVVTSHIDTVPPFIGYSRAEGPLTKETIIKGRGTADAKGSVATQVTALLELLSKDQVDGDDVMLAFVVGEETGGAGMQYFSSVMAFWPVVTRACLVAQFL
jgi:acetylornithine deacetylase